MIEGEVFNLSGTLGFMFKYLRRFIPDDAIPALEHLLTVAGPTTRVNVTISLTLPAGKSSPTVMFPAEE